MWKATMTIILAMAAAAGAAGNYMPMNMGDNWTYRLPNGAEMTVQVAGFEDVNGIRCAAVQTQTPGQPVFTEYLAADATGVRAYKMAANGQETVYPQPQLRIRLPFQPGQTWANAQSANGQQVLAKFESLGYETVTVPGGTFKCIRIRMTVSAAAPDQPAQQMTFVNDYAENVGLVQVTAASGPQQFTIQLASTSRTGAGNGNDGGGAPEPPCPNGQNTPAPQPTPQAQDGDLMSTDPKTMTDEQLDDAIRDLYRRITILTIERKVREMKQISQKYHRQPTP